MVNPAIVGRTYPVTDSYLVGREAVRAFARATGCEAAVCVDPAAAREAGYPDVVAPPTFVVVVSQRAEQRLLFDPEAGVDFAHLVHGEQSFEQRRPIVAGDELVAQLTVESVKTLGANTMLTTRTLVSEAGTGVEVAVATASFVIREVA